ncbi:MAG: hypothetical protein ACRDRJ_46380 [Streptosporangiaceae bacterium]
MSPDRPSPDRPGPDRPGPEEALALRTLAGLDVPAIARAFLVPEATEPAPTEPERRLLARRLSLLPRSAPGRAG